MLLAAAFGPGFSVADHDLAEAERVLKTSDKIYINVVKLPGCTEPHSEWVVIDKVGGTVTHSVDKTGREPEKSTVIKVKISSIVLAFPVA